MKTFTVRALSVLLLLAAPVMMLWAQEANEKYSMTTLMFLNELKEQPKQPAATPRHIPVRRLPGGTAMPKQHRLIASPDTVGGVAYISCFIHLKDANDLSDVRSLGVEVEEHFDGMDFVTARVPVKQLEALAGVDNVTKIKVAQCMRPLTDKAREVTNVDDLLTQSPDALALGVNSKYDGTGVILGIIDTGIDFRHIAFKDKDGNSRIKKAYIYNGSKATEYDASSIGNATTDDKSEDHGTHTATTAGGSSVIVNGTNVTVTDDHANATYGGMAPGADLYLAGINGLSDTYLSNALKKMVTYADNQNKPLVVSNSWGSGWGPRDGTGDWATLVGQYFGDSHPNRVILFASSNDAGHKNGNEGGGYFVKKSSASSSSPLGTIIRTDGYGGDYYEGLMACAYSTKKLNCKIYVLNSSGSELNTNLTVQSTMQNIKTFSSYYGGSFDVYIEQENGKYRLAIYSEGGLESKNDGNYTLAIEVYPESGSANINMWAGDRTFFTDHLTTSGHTWTDGTDDMCVSDQATIPDAISIGAYVSKKNWKASNGSSYTSSEYTVGDIAYFSSYATAEQSPTGLAYPWISAPGARLAAGVNHYHTTSVDSYSYYGSRYSSDLVVNNSSSPYAMMEGTSMATPVAAGIVALWLQAASEAGIDLTVNDVKAIMEATAINDTYTTTGANASHFGKGKIDALAGIQYILGSSAGPVIKATPTSIDFGSVKYDNGTYTKTLNVKGFNLEDGVTVTLADANGVYSLSQTSITQSAAAEGVDITITFAPQAEGTFNGTVTLTSAGAESVVVNLTGTAANTSDETIDFSQQGYSNGAEVTSLNGSDCTITFDKGSNSNKPTYYTTGEAIRLYGGNSMTIASTDKTIIKIELTFGSGDGTNDITTDVKSYSNGTWAGSASSVTFTIDGTTGHRRIQKVKVTYAASPVVGSGKYELVTDASKLAAGDKILIAYINGDDKYVLSTTQNDNNRAAANDVTLNADGTLTPGETAQVITLEKDGDKYLFNVGNGYLYAASSDKNYLRTETEADNNAKATVSVSAGDATIVFQGTNTRNLLRFNSNNGSPIFSCYASTSSVQTLPQIYREVPPSFIVGDANGDGSVTISDAVAIVNKILGNPSGSFNEEAADVNGDGQITITDAVGVVNIILNNGGGSSAPKMEEPDSEAAEGGDPE